MFFLLIKIHFYFFFVKIIVKLYDIYIEYLIKGNSISSLFEFNA